MNATIRIVNRIPGTERNTKGTYFKFWKAVRNTPKGKFLEIKAPTKEQKLISHHLYYKGRKTRTKVSVTFKPKAMYVSWK